MKTFTIQSRSSGFLRSAVFLLIVMLAIPSCTYMKMNPPSDADKTFAANNNSCYLATASNLLAGAGYGNGTDLQARADGIYNQMIGNFGTTNGGWTDTALIWWLSSSHNTWANNPYTVVNVYGNKSPKYPWNDANGTEIIGNHLRACDFVGLSISWPDATPGAIGSGGHAITIWGDNLGRSKSITANPTELRVTDSDSDAGGDVQAYSYDAFTNPNPGGANEGNGWYFNYNTDHPYIKHIAVLSPIKNQAGNPAAQTVIGSYKIHQDNKTAATDLHYTVGTDVDILSYWTGTDWDAQANPAISEASPRRSVVVDWDFSSKPLPYCTWVTITTEFILPYWNAISYRDMRFTYPSGINPIKVASIQWRLDTPKIQNAASIPNVTGGYVIGAFDIIDPSRPTEIGRVGEYRFVHQYSYTQSPEFHVLRLAGENGFTVSNLRLGHSYGLLTKEQLWEVKEWMTTQPDARYELSEKPMEIRIDWKGRLPYPEGEIVPDWMRKRDLRGTSSHR